MNILKNRWAFLSAVLICGLLLSSFTPSYQQTPKLRRAPLNPAFLRPPSEHFGLLPQPVSGFADERGVHRGSPS